jgi:hypothetical protein
VDQLYLNTIGFPVQKGTLHRNPRDPSAYSWAIEIVCDESPQLDFRSWADDRPEEPDDWLAGTAVMLGAQRLPLRVQSPDELVGRDYWFPPPDDDPAEWSHGLCWPYFFLYVWEGYPTEPLHATFTGQRDGQYRVEIAGAYIGGGTAYELRVQTWLEWLG